MTGLSSTVGAVRSLLPPTPPFFIMEAPLLSGAIREMKHLVPYASRLFGNSDVATSWVAVAYTLSVNYHHDIKTGRELQLWHGHKALKEGGR